MTIDKEELAARFRLGHAGAGFLTGSNMLSLTEDRGPLTPEEAGERLAAYVLHMHTGDRASSEFLANDQTALHAEHMVKLMKKMGVKFRAP